MIGEINVCNLKASGEVSLPLNTQIEFCPTDIFKRHPRLFKRFRGDDLRALNLSAKRADLDKDFLDFADVNKVLENCTHMKQLEAINLDDSDLNSNGLRYLDGFSKIKALCLARCALPTEEIAKYKYLKQLSFLKLITSTKITPVLEKLRDSKAILVLVLNKSYFDDNDARLLGEIKQLRSLEIRATRITDEAIKVLPANLVELNVESCKITPASIDSFSRYKQLRHLQINTKTFSPEDLQRLKKNVPLAHLTSEQES